MTTLLAILFLAANLHVIPAPSKIEPASPEQIAATNITVETKAGMTGYTLDTTPHGIRILAGNAESEFYARQTLAQLNDDGRLPCVHVEDAPRYEWRGFMLDESRHFFGKAVVKQLLDVMAELKLNRFHWHLTDEPGWRIEIKKYPKLTEIGAVGNYSNRNAPRAFYTQDDIREIVAYAAARHIVIIPEIDMPGHATAATRAYPGLSGGGTGRFVGFTFHPVKEETYRFIEDVLTEVAALFPGPYIHIGGDEVSFGTQTWKTDPQIQQFIAAHKLKDTVGLEQHFIRRAVGIVNKLGKTAVGWDEIVDAGVPAQHCVVMWWRHDKPQVLANALTRGYTVVLTPRRPCYLDFVQHDSHKIGRRWKGFNDLDGTYDFPAPTQTAPKVLGLEACLWTERIADKHRLDFMTFPRLAAIAEDAWTNPDAKNLDSFRTRLRDFLRRLDKLGIYYFDPFDPSRTPEPSAPDKADALANG